MGTIHFGHTAFGKEEGDHNQIEQTYTIPGLVEAEVEGRIGAILSL